jgi:hypothetical protein
MVETWKSVAFPTSPRISSTATWVKVMQAIVLTHNHFDADHLAKGQSEMAEMGAHRLRAAHALTPVIDPIEWSEDVTTEDIGTDHQDVWTIAEICERNAHNITLVFQATKCPTNRINNLYFAYGERCGESCGK